MRRYLVFSVVSLALLLSSISSSAVSVAFPVLISDLSTTLVMAGWVLTAYQLVNTMVMPLAGKISEMLGKRAMFTTYTALFVAGSVLCSLAPNVYLLTGARVVQALGGGGFLPSAAGILSEQFPEARQRYIGLISSILPIGMVIGPNIGGWMVASFGWRSIFWFNVPLGIIVLVLSWVLLPAKSTKGVSTRMDLVGTGLLFGALLSFMFGLTTLGNSSTHIQWVLISLWFALSIALGIFFLRWEGRVKEPIIDLELLKRGPFLAANIYNIIYGICGLGLFSLLPLYAVNVYGMSIFQSGFVMTARSLAIIIFSALTSFSLVKWGYRRPILAGTLIATFSIFLLAFEPRGIGVKGWYPGDVTMIMAISGLGGLGNGICTPAASNACIELMPDKVTTIAGLRGMFRNMGMTIGISIATVALNMLGNEGPAFFTVLLAGGVLMLFSVPPIFGMPASPNVGANRQEVKAGST